MPDTCCAVGCTNRRSDKESRPFYRFPSKSGKKVELRKKWIQACKRDQWPEEKIENARICGDHFITGKKKNYI